ncbi:hypothetical protein VPH35_052748 [Triticum aestivum]
MRRPVRACGGELRRYGPRYMYISLSLSLFSRHLLTSYLFLLREYPPFLLFRLCFFFLLLWFVSRGCKRRILGVEELVCDVRHLNVLGECLVEPGMHRLHFVMHVM